MLLFCVLFAIDIAAWLVAAPFRLITNTTRGRPGMQTGQWNEQGLDRFIRTLERQGYKEAPRTPLTGPYTRRWEAEDGAHVDITYTAEGKPTGLRGHGTD